MVCTYCSTPTRVVNSRHQRRSNDIWRRRTCDTHRHTFTTIERADLPSTLRVETTDGQLHAFSRDQLFISLYESCKHRPTATRDAGNITQQVITKLVTGMPRPGLVTRQDIISSCLAALKPFDAAAATFYAAYHPL